ncbi:MAG: helix-turn-helix domain-containing protein [Phycisphaerae bacterium]|nr:helix-turn-helix domain-containing protein [Phycisphaerae bacterium]
MPKDSLIRAIRAAIAKDPRSLYRLAKDAGLPYGTVHRFATKERTELGLRTASAICDALGLHLTKRRRR